MKIELPFLKSGMSAQQGLRAESAGGTFQGGGCKIDIAKAGYFEGRIDGLGGIGHRRLIVLVCHGGLRGSGRRWSGRRRSGRQCAAGCSSCATRASRRLMRSSSFSISSLVAGSLVARSVVCPKDTAGKQRRSAESRRTRVIGLWFGIWPIVNLSNGVENCGRCPCHYREDSGLRGSSGPASVQRITRRSAAKGRIR